MLEGTLLFLVATGLTLVSAKKLAYYGDEIASTTSLGAGLVGLLLLSFATSLPEFASSVWASFLGNVDLAFGNVFGSNMTNIFILVIMDMYLVGRSVLYYVKGKNMLAGGVVIALTIIVLFFMELSGFKLFIGVDLWYLSLVLFIIYVYSMILLYRHDKGLLIEEAGEGAEEGADTKGTVAGKLSKGNAIRGFVLSTVFVFVSSILLSYSCNIISNIEVGGKALGGTFVGTLLMALATSLPEIVVSLAAIKLKSFDMALGNIFGSNIFNLAILSFTDIAYRLGTYWRDGELVGDNAFALASKGHIISGYIGILFVSIVLVSLLSGRSGKRFRLGFDTMLIGLLYILGLYLIFLLR